MSTEALAIETATSVVLPESRHIPDLMGLYGLTAYDTYSLELVLFTGLPLAPFDRKLSIAAQLAGVNFVTNPIKSGL